MDVNNQPVIKRQPALTQQVTDYLTSEIRNGGFKPGEVFPSEAELAEKLDVSRTVVREALSRMKHDGILESRRGGRSRVAQDPTGRVFRFDPAGHTREEFFTHLYELRVIIEPEAAAFAAVRGQKEDIEEIENRYQQLEDALQGGQDATEESRRFHEAVIMASGNEQLAKFVNWVEQKIWAFSQEQDNNAFNDNLLNAQKEHTAIVEAIKAGDAQKAREVSREHVLNAAGRHGVELEVP